MIRFLTSIVRTAVWVATRENLPLRDPADPCAPAPKASVVRSLLSSGGPLPAAAPDDQGRTRTVTPSRMLLTRLLERETLPRSETASLVSGRSSLPDTALSADTAARSAAPASSRPGRGRSLMAALLERETLARSPVPEPGGPGRSRTFLATLLETEDLPPAGVANPFQPGTHSEPE